MLYSPRLDREKGKDNGRKGTNFGFFYTNQFGTLRATNDVTGIKNKGDRENILAFEAIRYTALCLT